jgi:hypothetical protein
LIGAKAEWRVAGEVWIKGAKIVGALDLMRAKTKCGLMIEGCHVQAIVNLCFAEVPDLWLTGCRGVCLVAQQVKTGFLSVE